jgi:hypothetical protein
MKDEPVQHVYPLGDLREHVIDGVACWCGPRRERPCSACTGPDPGCWACGGAGWVPSDCPHVDRPLVVIHEAADGRE